MSYIPDCRTDDTYNEKYLNEADSQYISGYDHCVEELTESFFSNIDNIADDISELIEDVFDIKCPAINPELITADKGIEEYPEDAIEAMGQLNALLMMVKQQLSDWAERCRDEIITSMIEDMDEKKYFSLKVKADKEKYKNAIIRRREYLKKMAAGEIPTCWEYTVNENGEHVKIGHCPNGTNIVEKLPHLDEN